MKKELDAESQALLNRHVGSFKQSFDNFTEVIFGCQIWMKSQGFTPDLELATRMASAVLKDDAARKLGAVQEEMLQSICDHLRGLREELDAFKPKLTTKK